LLGDLAVRQSLQVVQQHHFTVYFRNLVQRGKQLLAQFRPECHTLQWDHAPAGLIAQVIAGTVSHDLHQPGAEPIRMPAVVDVLDGRSKRILGNIFGIGDISRDRERYRPAGAKVPLGQIFRRDAVPQPHPSDQLRIRVGNHASPQDTTRARSVESGTCAVAVRRACFA
jgi:hypothetical protein